MKSQPQILHFPDNFLFGTSTAAHQIEGNNTNSDWWQWEQDGRVKEKSGKACDSWNRWKEDVDLAKSLHNNAYRFSLEWARIEPEEGKFNLAAIKHYEEIIRCLHEQKMQAMLTLWHFSLPAWFARKGGFTKKSNLKYFSRFVSFALDSLEERPDQWITLNEPNSYLNFALTGGLWPPGRKSLATRIWTYFNFLSAHKSAYTLIHKKIPGAKVSLSSFVVCVETLPANFLLQKVANSLVNGMFFWPLRKKLDFLAVNYYLGHLFKWRKLFPDVSSVEPVLKMLKGEKNDIGWPSYPEGLYRVLLSLKGYGLPIIITENGVADQKDIQRRSFIADHLEYLWEAIEDGVNVQGYFHWTLMDNFEWALGYQAKYGLFETNFGTLERKARPSALAYAKICHDRALTLD